MSYGQYRAVLATNRSQADRRAAFLAHYGTFHQNVNTYASLYHSVCQRDWFYARARGYKTTLDAALHGNAIPRSVVDTLIEATRAGVAPLRRYHKLRRRALPACGFDHLHEPWDIVRVVLAVGIHRDHDIAGSVTEPGVEG